MAGTSSTPFRKGMPIIDLGALGGKIHILTIQFVRASELILTPTWKVIFLPSQYEYSTSTCQRP